MTVLGITFALCAVITAVFRRGLFPWVLAASAALPASAAFSVGSVSVSPFHMLAALACVLLATRPRAVISGPGVSALGVFVVWAIAITVLAPILFDGTAVLTARTGIDIAVRSPEPLTYTISGGGQIAYLLLSLGALLYLVEQQASPLLAAAPLVVGTLLSSLRAFSAQYGIPWPSMLFDTARNVIYADSGIGARARGVFAEPSELAGFSLAAFAFALVGAVAFRGINRALATALAALALSNLILASSGTALVATALFLCIAAAWAVVRGATSGSGWVFWLALAALTIGVASLFLGDLLISWGTSIVNAKLGSESMSFRTQANTFSFGLVQETLGLGVGLGGNRPSSFLAMMLSCVGLFGTGVFVILLILLLRGTLARSTAAATAWALVALLLAKTVALPDLSTPMLWILIAGCACALWRRSTARFAV